VASLLFSVCEDPDQLTEWRDMNNSVNHRMKSFFLLLLLMAAWVPPAQAHHVLGRPAYSLNEDSNTPPSMQVETQIGDYYVTYMVFPAFPRPNEPGRINLYARRMDDNQPFPGQVTFKVRDDNWFHSNEETLGVQPPVDNVFRQNFQFLKDGDYIITASFEADGAPYIIDFPLRIGKPSAIGPIGMAIAAIAILLLAVNLIQRKRSLRDRIRHAHAGDKARKKTHKQRP